MEKEKPMLVEDLIPPGEIDTYEPDESDVIPIRTWSRGDSFDIGGGIHRARGTGRGSVGGSQSTDGMLHYTSIQQVFDGQGQIDEEQDMYGDEEGAENDDEEYAGDDYEEDGEFIPSYQFSGAGFEYGAEDGAEGEYETDDQNEDQYETEEGEDEGEEGSEGYEDEEGGGGEDEDEVNYDDGESEFLIGADDTHNASFTIDNEHFEKVTLSPRELDLIASSGPGEFNDLVDIMNEYNELVNYLSSPRSNAKKPGKQGAAKVAGDKAAAAKSTKAPVVPPVQRRILQSDSEGEESDGQEGDEHSASSASLLARNKLNIMSAMVSNAAAGSQGDNKDHAGAPRMPKKTKKAAVNQASKGKKPKKKLFGYALEEQKRLAMQLKLVARSEVDDKHKAMLAGIVEARKREEEEFQRDAERALAKRKKFKEALLEKALKARQAQLAEEETMRAAGIPISPTRAPPSTVSPAGPGATAAQSKSKKEPAKFPAGGAPPNFLAPTKAFQVQSMPAKTAQQVILTDEDLVRQEQEKHDHIAAIRRKFKEQHKKILNALKKKNEEDGKKLEEELAREAIKKEKHRQKLLKMLAEKTEKGDAAPLASVDDAQAQRQTVPAPQPAMKLPRSAQPSSAHSRQQQQAAGGSADAADVAEDSADTGAAGGGLAAIRRRARSLSQNAAEAGEEGRGQSLLAQQRLLLKQQKEEEAAVEDALKEAMQKELRKAASKEQQAKLTSYLNNIAEQRKREEIDKKKKEERSKKRVAILSARLLQEGNERKQMQQNDDWRYAQSEVVASVTASTNTKPTASAKVEPGAVSHKPRPPAAPAPSTVAATATAAPAPTSSGVAASESTKAPKKVKITSEMTEKLVNRLKSQKVTVEGGSTENENFSNVPARDFADWKRKNGVPADAQVFAMTGWYPCVKEALIARGWYYNSDNTSPFFNLKWTLRSLDVLQETLQPWQLTNHYLKNVAITTKAGLIKSLQSLVWTADVEANDIIPRGYDLSNNVEMQAFLDDFRSQKAESVLKALYLQLTGLELPAMKRDLPPLKSPRQPTPEADEGSQEGEGVGSSASGDTGDLTSHKQKNETDGGANKKVGGTVLKSESLDESIVESEEPDFPPVPSLAPGIVLQNITVNVAVFEAILTVLEKQIKPYEDSYIDDRDAQTEKMITDLEWELISQYKIDQAFPGLPAEAPEPVDTFLKEKEDLDTKPTAQQQRDKRRQQKLDEEAREAASVQGKKTRPLTMQDLERIHYTLCSLMFHSKYQTGLNGKGNKSLNMWIVKPAAKSRGRGITTFMDLNKLLKYVDAGTGRYAQWIVQKYMENPLIIAQRKFDLRQWVVVTNWNPVTIYFYDECYARFSVEEYSTDVNDLSNAYIHLVNNSIGKNSENFSKIISAENGVPVEGYMWSFDQVAEFMKFRTGKDLMRSKVHPRMKDIAKWSLMCAAEMIEHRKNSWELYGFDFMVDDEYNAWLIEINSSPACDYSTPVTEVYVQKALVELLNVVLDVREWEAQPKKTRGPCPDTGGWEKIYQGPLLEMPVGAFGTEMSLKGEAYKNVPNRNSNTNAVNVTYQQVDFGNKTTTGAATAAPGNAASTSQGGSVSTKVSRTIPQPAAAPDSPKRIARSHTVGATTSAAATFAEARPAADKHVGKKIAEQDHEEGPNFEEDSQDFDDSDDEVDGNNTSKPKRTKPKPVMLSQLAETAQAPTAPVVESAVTSKQGKPEASSSKGLVRQNVGGPAVASIPIKVFSVEF